MNKLLHEKRKRRVLSDSRIIADYDRKIRLRSDKKVYLRKKTTKQPQIHCLYFSCKNDFINLLTSLKSLARLKLTCIGTVYIYMDEKYPFSRAQIKQLHKEISFYLRIKKTKYPFAEGINRCVSLLVALRQIHKDIYRNDYVMKIDSDVLFIVDIIFRDVLKSNADAISHDNYGDLEGGSFSLRGSLISKIIKQPIARAVKEVCSKFKWPLEKCQDDKLMTELVKQCGGKMHLKRFMLEALKPPFIRKRGSKCELTKDNIRGYSYLHFTYWFGLKKEDMRKTWEWLCSKD